MRCHVGLTGSIVAMTVVVQSAEQVCREVEAADAASVARLVRGVLSSRSTARAAVVFVLMLCIL